MPTTTTMIQSRSWRGASSGISIVSSNKIRFTLLRGLSCFYFSLTLVGAASTAPAALEVLCSFDNVHQCEKSGKELTFLLIICVMQVPQIAISVLAIALGKSIHKVGFVDLVVGLLEGGTFHAQNVDN